VRSAPPWYVVIDVHRVVASVERAGSSFQLSEGSNPAGLTAHDLLVGESEVHRSHHKTRHRYESRALGAIHEFAFGLSGWVHGVLKILTF
jgi:hypothetical protein